MTKRRSTTFAAFLLVLAIAARACAQTAGSLDTSFSSDGIAEIFVRNSLFVSATAETAVRAPDGKILIGFTNDQVPGPNRDIAVARLLSNGQLDNTFGTNGIVFFPSLSRLNNPSSYHWLTVDSSNRPVLTARVIIGSGRYATAVARLTTGGALDSSFGGGTGIVPVLYEDVLVDDESGYAIAISPQGKVVVASRVRASTATLGWTTAVARLTSDGVIDASFNQVGHVVLRSGSGVAGPPIDIAVDAAENVYAAYSVSGTRMVVRKLLPSGAVDTSYGNSGTTPSLSWGVTTNSIYPAGMRLYSDGKVLLYGAADAPVERDCVWLRFTSNGQADNSFAGDGSLWIAVASADDYILSTELDSDGRILTALFSQGTSQSVLQRLNDDGTVDSTFATNGRRALGYDTYGVVRNLVLLPSGRFVVAAQKDEYVRVYSYDTAASGVDSNFGTNGFTSFTGFAPLTVATASANDARPTPSRYYIAGSVLKPTSTLPANTYVIAAVRNSDGQVDTTWGGSNGYVIGSYGSADNNLEVGSIAPLSNGKVLAVFGVSSAFSGNPRVVIERRNSDGAIDSSFGSSGYVFGSPSGQSVFDPIGTVLASGNIFVAGRGSNGQTLYANMLTSSGGSVSAFGSAGILISSGDSTFSSFGFLTQVVAGPTNSDAYVVASAGSGSNYRGFVWKFNVDGVVSTFGNAGRARVDPGSGYTSSRIHTGLIVPDTPDFIYVGGFVANAQSQFLFVARLRTSTGALDTTWADGGRLIVSDLNGSFNYVQRLVWDASLGRIIAFGVSAQRTTSRRVVIFRIDPQTAQLDCFGQLGGVLRRDPSDGGVIEAFQSGSRYVVATASTINLRLVRYIANGPTSCDSVCGNGILEATEQCDDGNTRNGDGCSSVCLYEPGFDCPNPGAPCIPLTPDDPPVVPPPTIQVTPSSPPPPVRAPVSSPRTSPVAAPVSQPQSPPTKPPAAVPIAAPVKAPTQVPTASPVAAPVSSPQSPPTKPPAAAPVSSPRASPVVAPLSPQSPPTKPPAAVPIAAPVQAPTLVPSASPVVIPPISAPVGSPSASPISAPEATAAAPVAVPVASSQPQQQQQGPEASPLTSPSPIDSPTEPTTDVNSPNSAPTNAPVIAASAAPSTQIINSSPAAAIPSALVFIAISIAIVLFL